MNVEVLMETRYCVGCGQPFRVMTSSPQKYHSSRCECERTGKPSWDDPKRASLEEKKRRESQKVCAIKMTPSTEKKLIKEEEPITLNEKKPNESAPVPITVLTKRRLIKEEPSGEEETKIEPTSSKESIIMRTEKVYSEKSLTPVKSDSPTEDSHGLSETLKTEQSESMNLINSSVRQLKTVLDSVAEKHKGNEARQLTSMDIDDICKLSGAITGLMKVKVDAVRAAADVIRATK